MDLPPTNHFIYIPLVLILGVVFGFIWGARATQEAYRLEARRTEEVAKKKAERQAARKAAAEAAAGTGQTTIVDGTDVGATPAGSSNKADS